MTDKATDMIVSPEGESQFDMSLVASPNIIAIADEAEKRLDALVKIKNVALKATNPKDWVDQSGTPWLQASGAEKIGRIFGISWRISEPVKEDLDAGHYIFSYTGEFALWGSVITAVGTRSSRDPFFKKYQYYKDKDRTELPASEIDEGDVKKSAYSNLLANGITRLLGIRNLTYADLTQFANITEDQVRKIEHKKGGKPIEKQASQGEPPVSKQPSETAKPAISDPTSPATEDQCYAIHSLLRDKLKITDEFAKHEKVSKMLGMQKILTSMSQLTKGDASKVIAALQEEAKTV